MLYSVFVFNVCKKSLLFASFHIAHIANNEKLFSRNGWSNNGLYMYWWTVSGWVQVVLSTWYWVLGTGYFVLGTLYWVVGYQLLVLGTAHLAIHSRHCWTTILQHQCELWIRIGGYEFSQRINRPEKIETFDGAFWEHSRAALINILNPPSHWGVDRMLDYKDQILDLG